MKRMTPLVAASAAVLCLFTWIQPGTATEVERQASEFAFDVADRDNDGVISEAELAYDTAVGFAALDADGDEHLVPSELQTHDPADFQRVDTDNDGRLSFGEVIKVKVKVLEDADTDSDGVLSKDEVLSYDAQYYKGTGS